MRCHRTRTENEHGLKTHPHLGTGLKGRFGYQVYLDKLRILSLAGHHTESIKYTNQLINESTKSAVPLTHERING